MCQMYAWISTYTGSLIWCTPSRTQSWPWKREASGFADFSTFEVWQPNTSITMIIHHTLSINRIHHHKHNIFDITFGLLRGHWFAQLLCIRNLEKPGINNYFVFEFFKIPCFSHASWKKLKIFEIGDEFGWFSNKVLFYLKFNSMSPEHVNIKP